MITQFLVVLLTASSVQAQDFDNPTQEKKKRERKTYQLQDQRQVREIERGWYAKSNVGGGFYFGTLGQWMNAGSVLGLIGGQDFIDREKMSVAWEAGLLQGVHNGVYPEIQAASGCIETGTCVQGDADE